MIFNDFNLSIVKQKCHTKAYSIVLLIMLLAFAVARASAQSEYQSYSYQFYQKLNTDLYSTQNNEHTAIKSLFIDSALKARYDSLRSGWSPCMSSKRMARSVTPI
jgi:hypothetical protein